MEKPPAEPAVRAPSTSAGISPQEAREITRAAFSFGLPLVYLATQIDVVSNVPRPVGERAPINQFAHHRAFPDASNKTVVGLNVDTLYSIAPLDLEPGPLVLSVPEMGQRFWIMQLIDAWNNVPHAPGSRTRGGAGGHFAITGPKWQGSLPTGVTELRMPTKLGLLCGRIYTAGPGDYAAVHQVQDQVQLIPLARWGTPFSPPASLPPRPGIDAATPVPRQIFALSAEAFFNRLNTLLAKNPAFADDAPLLARAAKLGIAPGARFELARFAPNVRSAIEAGVAAGQQDIRTQEAARGQLVNGWSISREVGRYGSDYLRRAVSTFFGVGGNLPEDALYPVSFVDSDGEAFDASRRYVLHFTKPQLPPVAAFWSLTLYDKDSYLVPNPLNRAALGDRSDLRRGADGSLTLNIQSESPGKDLETNWLPAPKQGAFKLVMRLYGPRPEALDGSWAPPPVRVMRG